MQEHTPILPIYLYFNVGHTKCKKGKKEDRSTGNDVGDSQTYTYEELYAESHHRFVIKKTRQIQDYIAL